MASLEMYEGIPILFCPEYQVQKKSSRFKIIHWIYKKIYGFKTEYTMPTGQIIYMNDSLVMSKETYENLKIMEG